jgi:uncharacterized protein YydD (DUF2326 family)
MLTLEKKIFAFFIFLSRYDSILNNCEMLFLIHDSGYFSKRALSTTHFKGLRKAFRV